MSQTVYDHDQIKLSLRDQLLSFSELVDNGWKIESEKHIEPPVKTGSRRIDVAIQTDQAHQKGYAFEIKTINADGYFLHRQLRDYLIAGFQPILVAPRSMIDRTVPGKPVPFEWILDFLGAGFAVMEDEDQFNLELEENRMTGDHIKMFFNQFC